MDQEEFWKRHDVVKHFTEAELQQRGMLELDNAQRPTLTNAIHPIFRQANWVDVRPIHQTQLRPCLRLASHFITNHHLLPFWHALLFGPRLEVPRNIAVGPDYGHTLHTFHRIFDFTTASYAVSTLELKRTEDALVSLAGSIQITVNREPTKISGILTTKRTFDSAPAAGFAGSTGLIEIDRRLLDTYSQNYLTISERLRLQYYIASSMVHELAHAVEGAVTPMLPRSPTRQGPPIFVLSEFPDEPFFERDRLAECGHAWDSCVIGGRPCMWGDEFPAGYAIGKWPGIDFRDDLPVRAKAKRWTTVYFVPMEHIQALFTNKFWSDEGIGRYGAGEVIAKKTFGWREYNTGDVVSDDDEGISWGDSSRGRIPDSDGVIRHAAYADPSFDPFQWIEFGAGEVDEGGDTVMG
ncbi:MAG: hypothetical protein M1830_005348 [Pleopsidium flavum]|nr:MAG: hypothetical protein M1830_005348 [Pleopsidium flavum]